MTENQIVRAGELASVPLPVQTNSPQRILVVEDDGDIRRLNVEALSNSGYEVEAAADGAAAWDELHLNDYDLVVTDNNMPKLSGFELLQKLRAARMVLPVIMATGALPQQDFTSSPWMQPDATLLKPYTIEELLRMVKKVLCATDAINCSFPLGMKDNKTEPAEASASAPRPRPVHSPLRILVVDEDRDLRQMYSEALAVPGYEVVAAEDGDAGWRALQVQQYHLLITEHDLPKLTGMELVRKLRAAHMALPVVMAVARLPKDALDQNPALQPAAVLLKPFAVDALLHTVKEVLYAPASARSWTGNFS